MNTVLPPAPDKSLVRVVMIGDVVGKPGLKITCESVPWLRQRLHAHVIIANAENAADGAGLRVREYRRLREAGIDAVTLGDHIYRKKEIIEALNNDDRIVKPGNFPESAPGKTWCSFEIAGGIRIGLISLMGRVFMRPVDCPFAAANKILNEMPDDIRIRLVDFHAEATSDKQVLGRFLDGRVTAILGTHTHVTTADEQILPNGTGFQCDIGMTGPYLSIIGREIAPVLATTLSFDPNSFDVATEDIRLAATWLDADPVTGHCVQIGRIQWPWELIEHWKREAAELALRM
jgi:2',3'-cyclic-nucleotide 2'-phosphodiesterase